jgi:hypothetical protein
MSELHVIPKTAQDKHCLCLMADTELVLLRRAIRSIWRLFLQHDHGWMGFLSPLPLFRPAAVAHLQIHARYEAMNHRVASVKCYIALKAQTPGGLTNVPMPKDDGAQWLSGFLQEYRNMSVDYHAVCREVVLVSLAFLMMIKMDTAKHALFAAHYGPSINEAFVRLMVELIGDEDPKVEHSTWKQLWAPKLEWMMDSHPYLCPLTGERFIMGVASLSERGVVEACAAAFRCVLKNWDTTHGLVLPRVRTILEAFAFGMEPLYEQGCTQLTHLFH